MDSCIAICWIICMYVYEIKDFLEKTLKRCSKPTSNKQNSPFAYKIYLYVVGRKQHTKKK